VLLLSLLNNNFRAKEHWAREQSLSEEPREEHLADVPLRETEATSASQLFLAVKIIHASNTQFHNVSPHFLPYISNEHVPMNFQGTFRSAFLNRAHASSFTSRNIPNNIDALNDSQSFFTSFPVLQFYVCPQQTFTTRSVSECGYVCLHDMKFVITLLRHCANVFAKITYCLYMSWKKARWTDYRYTPR